MHRLLLLFLALLLFGCAPGLQKRIETASPGAYKGAESGSEACAAGVEHLKAIAGVPVIEIEGLQAWGATDFSVIFLRAGLNSCTQLEVLAHEVAHLRQPAGLLRREAEVFADLVSLRVVKALAHYDPTPRYLPYLAQAKPDARLAKLYRREIAEVVKEVTESFGSR